MSAPVAVPLYDKLAALLAESREDTTEADWRGAMLAAQTVGWSWERTFAEIGRIVQQRGGPWMLRDAVSHLPKPHAPKESR
jgi:hypothetical protein